MLEDPWYREYMMKRQDTGLHGGDVGLVKRFQLMGLQGGEKHKCNYE